MISLGKWRWPVVLLVPCGVAGAFYLTGLLHITFESQVLVSPIKGAMTHGSKLAPVMLKGQGSTPSAAVDSARRVIDSFNQKNIDQEKASIQAEILKLTERQSSLTARAKETEIQRRNVLKGSAPAPWTPEMARKLSELKTRRDFLASGFPTHTDIPVLNRQIQALEAQPRGRGKADPRRVQDLGRTIAELQTQAGCLALRMQALEQSKKQLTSAWTAVQPPVRPRWPADMPGWPLASAAMTSSLLLAMFLSKQDASHVHEGETGFGELLHAPVKPAPVKIQLAVLPTNDPRSQRASELYTKWCDLVRVVYAPSAEPPPDVLKRSDPLLAETMIFLTDGHDTMSRHLAQVVVPGDLVSHVTRTVLMALLGAHEAEANPEQQKGMMLAALFHDLAVVPRATDNWHEVGCEVGRLSSPFIRKIPGLTEPLVSLVEALLVGMDEYPLETWQNVSRDKGIEPFARLLRQIDRFDKVMQKQKTRLARRIAYNPAKLSA